MVQAKSATKQQWKRTIIWILLPLLLSLSSLLAYNLAQPPHSLRPKIFVLGLSKTGTTSIGDALETLGYRRLGWRDLRSRHMCYTWANGDLSGLVDLTRYYDAFEDLPWPKVYREMSALYPDAKFVLSVRRDEETWLRSMRTHVGRGEWQPYAFFYGATTVPGNEEVMLQSYRNHTREVREFFEDKKQRLVELNIDDGNEHWDVLCSIAQCPGGKIPAIAFPKANTAASWDMGWFGNAVQWYWGWTVTRGEEQAAKYYYERDWEVFRVALNRLWKGYDFVERAYTEAFFRVKAVVQPPRTVG